MEDTMKDFEVRVDEAEIQVEALRDAAKKQFPKKRDQKDIKEEKTNPEKFDKRKGPDELRKMTYDERQRYYNWCRDQDAELVKGVFKFYERPGHELEFVYRAYKGEGAQTYCLRDGQVYEIPLGVARHLNKDGWYPEYEYVPGGKTIMVPGGRPTNMRIQKKVRRFGFQTLDFVDGQDLAEYGEATNGLVSVEYVGTQNLYQK